jgi:hypothetical protein
MRSMSIAGKLSITGQRVIQKEELSTKNLVKIIKMTKEVQHVLIAIV